MAVDHGFPKVDYPPRLPPDFRLIRLIQREPWGRRIAGRSWVNGGSEFCLPALGTSTPSCDAHEGVPGSEAGGLGIGRGMGGSLSRTQTEHVTRKL